jgi:hypothetical protein
MRISDIVQGHAFMISLSVHIHLLGQVRPVEEVTSGAIMILSIVPFIILLAILKYRAAYHRKILKWQNFESGIGTGSSFSVYLREIFLWEAKTAPIYSPVLNGLWDSFCGFVVLLLFPPRFIFVYTAISWLCCFPYLFMARNNWQCRVKAGNFVYNNQRYTFIRGGLYHSSLEDGGQNTMYYPTAALHALVPAGNR